MSFGDIQWLNKAIAAAAAQGRGPGAQLADAVRAMQESLGPQFSVMGAVAESLGRLQADQAAVMRSMAQQIDFGKTLAAQVAEAMSPMRRWSHAISGALSPIHEMAHARRTMLEACLKPIQEAARLREQVLSQAMRPLEEMARAQQAMVAEVQRPFREAASFRQSLLHDMLKPLQEELVRIEAGLQDYAPNVQVEGDTLTVDGQTYGPPDISRIEHDFLYGQAGALVKSPAQIRWEQIPPATRWIVKVMLSALISVILQCMFFGVPNRTPSQAVHERKVEVRRVSKDLTRGSIQRTRPFVNSEHLAVHVAPRQRSTVVALLTYPQKVTIIEYRKKKRWMLVEWEDSFGNTRSGWVLGRYVFRQPGQKEAFGD